MQNWPDAWLLAARADLGPSFANEQQKAFYDSQAPEILYSGAMGAGKSRIGCEKILSLALRYPGAQFGIVRKTAASLTATTERTFWRDTMKGRSQLVVGRNKSDRWVEVARGQAEPSRIWFMGLDADPETGVASKVGSFDGAAIFADEAVELTEADWIMLLGRLRDPRMPWHQLMAATNPSFPTHWLKRRFTPPVPGEREYYHATAADNRFLPADFQKSIAALPDNVYGQRLGQGLWVMAEGAIYQWDPAQQLSPDPSTVWKEVVAGIDWGYVHAFACEIVGLSGSGRLAVLGEVYRRGTLLEDIIPILLRLQDALGISTFYADPSEPEYIATCQRAGVKVYPAQNDVAPGINVVATAMKQGMTIDPACRGLLDELPAYRWATQGKSGVLKDEPLKENDDACDALRYAVMGVTRGGVLLHV
jgi:PBSX family phage terminase large subunit